MGVLTDKDAYETAMRENHKETRLMRGRCPHCNQWLDIDQSTVLIMGSGMFHDWCWDAREQDVAAG